MAERTELTNLITERDRSAKIRDQKQTKFDRIGTGELKPGVYHGNPIPNGKDELEGDLQIVRARAKLTAQINNLEARISSLDQQIDPELPTLATDYQNQLTTLKTRVEEMKRLASQDGGDQLAQSIIRKWMAELDNQEQRAQQDPYLKRGLERLATQGLALRGQEAGQELDRQTVEIRPQSPLTLNPEKQTVMVKNNLEIKLSRVQFVLLSYFLSPDNAGREIPKKELLEVLHQAGAKGDQLRALGGDIEHKIGQMIFNRILETIPSGGKKSRWAILEEFLPVQPETPAPLEEKRLARFQQARKVFDIMIDGRSLKVQGKLAARSLESTANTSEKSRMPITDFIKAVYGQVQR